MPHARPLLSLSFPFRAIGDAATCQVVLLNISNNRRLTVLEPEVLADLLILEHKEKAQMDSGVKTISGLKRLRRKPSELRLVSWFLLLKAFQESEEETPHRQQRIQTLEAMLRQEDGRGVALKCLNALRHSWASESFTTSWLGTKKGESNPPLSMAFVSSLSEDPMQALRGVLRNLTLHTLLTEYRESKENFVERLPEILRKFNKDIATLLSERREQMIA